MIYHKEAIQGLIIIVIIIFSRRTLSEKMLYVIYYR